MERKFMTETELLDRALDAARRAYSPYSHFCVGAALLTRGGAVYIGCNIENASYPATICAERVAFSAAVAAGERDFDAIAIVGGREDIIAAGEPLGECPPCGICRQFMAEFCRPDFRVILGSPKKFSTYTLGELLPQSFSAESM